MDCLTYEEVLRVYRGFDAENDEDHRQIEANRRVIEGLLSDHWITLRPLLCTEEAMDETDPAYAEACLRAYERCLQMNRRLHQRLNQRREKLERVEEILSDALEILQAERTDWLHGRGGDSGVDGWFHRLEEELPRRLATMKLDRRADSESYRSLQGAYTAEREVLFRRDVEPEKGIWRSTYEAVQNGRLPRGTWNLYAERAEEMQDERGGEGYDELLLVLRTVSESIRMLLNRVEDRAAERRAVRQISGDEHWQIACLRGVLRDHPAWRECAAVVVDETFRSEYRAVVHRWEETRNLLDRRRTVFETYASMYNTYLATETSLGE